MFNYRNIFEVRDLGPRLCNALGDGTNWDKIKDFDKDNILCKECDKEICIIDLYLPKK